MTPTPTQAHPSPRRVAGGDTPHPVTACHFVTDLIGMAGFAVVALHLPEIIHFLAHMEALQ